MNDPAAPQTTPIVPSEQQKDLADAALRETGILNDDPSVQSTQDQTPPSVPETPPVGPSVSDTADNSAGTAQPEVPGSVQPEVSTPAPTPMPEIPVNDSTVAAPEEEPSTDTSAAVPPTPPSLDTPTVMGSESSTNQPATKPEGLMDKIIGFFKKK